MVNKSGLCVNKKNIVYTQTHACTNARMHERTHTQGKNYYIVLQYDKTCETAVGGRNKIMVYGNERESWPYCRRCTWQKKKKKNSERGQNCKLPDV